MNNPQTNAKVKDKYQKLVQIHPSLCGWHVSFLIKPLTYTDFPLMVLQQIQN